MYLNYLILHIRVHQEECTMPPWYFPQFVRGYGGLSSLIER